MKLSRLFVLTALIVLFSELTLSQTIFQIQSYNGIPQLNKKVLFEDHFDKNSGKWWLGDTTAKTVKITKGNLEITAKGSNINECIRPQINDNENFEIELSLRCKSGNSKRAFGLIWGKDEESKRFFSFTINVDGMMAINKFNGAYVSYLQPQKTKFVNGTSFNKLTLRKIDKFVYFFLNEQMVYSMQYFPSFGPLTGIVISADVNVLVEYFKVNTIDLSIKNNPPEITITEPKLIDNFAKLPANTQVIKISGKVKDEEPVKEVVINGVTIKTNPDGSFSTELAGLKEINRIKISATDNQFLTTEEYITLVLDDIQNSTPINSSDSIKPGRYYALIIAIGDYKDRNIHKLAEPLNDAERLKEILINHYTFDVRNVNILKNPTRKDVIIALDDLGNNLNEQDNLLIFYAGHGYWEKRRNIGFWLPSDSELDNTSNWIMNSTIQTYISTMMTHHTLIITDACFGGSIFSSRSGSDISRPITEIYGSPSRNAITSGDLETVPDKSVFLKYFCSQLTENKKKYITVSDLFRSIASTVKEKSNSNPQYGTIKNSGDQGGEFVFIRK